MNAKEPNVSNTVTGPASASTRRKYASAQLGEIAGLALFSGFAILFGALVIVAALTTVIQTLQGQPPKNAVWSLELGLLMLLGGIVVVIAGVAMWHRRQWGWWLMTGLLLVVSLVVSQGGIIQLGFIAYGLWTLRPQFGFPGPFRRLEPDIDGIAKHLGIEWTTTPLARIGELLAAKQSIEATRLYREHFGCNWDEAHAGIARWQTDLVVNKLRHIARSLNDPHQ